MEESVWRLWLAPLLSAGGFCFPVYLLPPGLAADLQSPVSSSDITRGGNAVFLAALISFLPEADLDFVF